MNEEIKQKYTDIGGLLDDALNRTRSIALTGEEENAELSAIKATLESMNENFKTEIDKLESSSEWDKFCIAYFGETNAGKSTIIESLRIIYNEESRWLEKNKQDKEYKTILSKHSEEYHSLLRALEDVSASLLQNSAQIQKSNFKIDVTESKVKKSSFVGFLLFIAGLVAGLIAGIIFF